MAGYPYTAWGEHCSFWPTPRARTQFQSSNPTHIYGTPIQNFPTSLQHMVENHVFLGRSRRKKRIQNSRDVGAYPCHFILDDLAVTCDNPQPPLVCFVFLLSLFLLNTTDGALRCTAGSYHVLESFGQQVPLLQTQPGLQHHNVLH